MVIKLNNLEVKKGSFKLGAINYTFDNGYVYAITGNSGSGKTLFLQTLYLFSTFLSNIFLYHSLFLIPFYSDILMLTFFYLLRDLT